MHKLRDGIQHQLQHGLGCSQGQLCGLAIGDILDKTLKMAQVVIAATHGPRIQIGGDDGSGAGAEKHFEFDAAPVLSVQLQDTLPVALLKVQG